METKIQLDYSAELLESTATRVPDEERSIERRTRRGGRERGEREERREGLCSIGYSFRYAHYYIIL